jgi:protein TonB
VVEAAPIMVSLIQPAETPKPAPPPPPAPQPVKPRPAPAPQPALPKQVPASALRYLVEPRTSVPLLSRRLGESGTVLLRVVVDVRGHLKEVSIRKSSGFARLDQQALQDIRSARFVPQTENGQPIEVESTAAFAYELD